MDLAKYGFQRKDWSLPNSYESSSQVVATRDEIVVAIGNPVATARIDTEHRVWDAQIEVFLYFFNVNNGDLIARRGPLRSDYDFDLRPTGKGNFLLLLRHLRGDTSNRGETLYLLSSLGEEMKKIDLAPNLALEEDHWRGLLISLSGRTVSWQQTLTDGVRNEILDADTLEEKIALTTRGESPVIIWISDSEALGIAPSEAGRKPAAEDKPRGMFIRTFDSPWRAYPATLDWANHLAVNGLYLEEFNFLETQSIVGLSRNEQQKHRPLKLVRTDGTGVSWPTIPGLPEHSEIAGPITVADQGTCFALRFWHRSWLSHLMLDVLQMDMAFSDDESIFVVWRTSDLLPLRRIEVGKEIRALSCPTNGSVTIASLDGSNLTVVRAAFDPEQTAGKAR